VVPLDASAAAWPSHLTAWDGGTVCRRNIAVPFPPHTLPGLNVSSLFRLNRGRQMGVGARTPPWQDLEQARGMADTAKHYVTPYALGVSLALCFAAAGRHAALSCAHHHTHYTCCIWPAFAWRGELDGTSCLSLLIACFHSLRTPLPFIAATLRHRWYSRRTHHGVLRLLRAPWRFAHYCSLARSSRRLPLACCDAAYRISWRTYNGDVSGLKFPADKLVSTASCLGLFEIVFSILLRM